MDKTQYQNASFQAFREQHQNCQAKSVMGNADTLVLAQKGGGSIYVVPNEEKVHSIRKELGRTNFDAYWGIVGGVLANFDYLTTSDQNPLVLLTDISNNAINHLAFLCLCTEGLNSRNAETNAQGFLANIIGTSLDESRLREVFGVDSKGQPIDLSLYQDSSKRNYVVRQVEEHFRSVSLEDGFNSWLANPSQIYEKFKEGMIKAYLSDLFNGGPNKAGEILKNINPKELAIYISNVVEDPKQIKSIVNRMIKDIDIKRLTLIGNSEKRIIDDFVR